MSTEGPDPKKQKTSGAGDAAENGNSAAFKNFELLRVLNENSQRKMVCLEGKFGADDTNKAVVIMEKTPFSEDIARQILTKDTQTHRDIQNDIYGTLQLYPQPQLNGKSFCFD